MRSGRIDEQSGPTATAEATERKVRWIREAAPDGRWEQLELQARIHLAMLTDDRPGLAEAMGPALGLTPAEAMETPHALCGSVEEIVQQCVANRERYGISYFTISADAMREFGPVLEQLRGR